MTTTQDELTPVEARMQISIDILNKSRALCTNNIEDSVRKRLIKALIMSTTLNGCEPTIQTNEKVPQRRSNAVQSQVGTWRWKCTLPCQKEATKIHHIILTRHSKVPEDSPARMFMHDEYLGDASQLPMNDNVEKHLEAWKEHLKKHRQIERTKRNQAYQQNTKKNKVQGKRVIQKRQLEAFRKRRSYHINTFRPVAPRSTGFTQNWSFS